MHNLITLWFSTVIHSLILFICRPRKWTNDDHRAPSKTGGWMCTWRRMAIGRPCVQTGGERPVLANQYIHCTLCVHRFPPKIPFKSFNPPQISCTLYHYQPFSNKISKFNKFKIPIAWEIRIFLHHTCTPKVVSGGLNYFSPGRGWIKCSPLVQNRDVGMMCIMKTFIFQFHERDESNRKNFQNLSQTQILESWASDRP
jgi:hypothetical protein